MLIVLFNYLFTENSEDLQYSMAFKQLNKVDKRTKYSVYGWIRNNEKSLKLSNVPSMITSICVLYFRDEEIFDVISKETELSGNKKMITKISEIIMKICEVMNIIFIWKLVGAVELMIWTTVMSITRYMKEI